MSIDLFMCLDAKPLESMMRRRRITCDSVRVFAGVMVLKSEWLQQKMLALKLCLLHAVWLSIAARLRGGHA